MVYILLQCKFSNNASALCFNIMFKFESQQKPKGLSSKFVFICTHWSSAGISDVRKKNLENLFCLVSCSNSRNFDTMLNDIKNNVQVMLKKFTDPISQKCVPCRYASRTYWFVCTTRVLHTYFCSILVAISILKTEQKCVCTEKPDIVITMQSKGCPNIFRRSLGKVLSTNYHVQTPQKRLI